MAPETIRWALAVREQTLASIDKCIHAEETHEDGPAARVLKGLRKRRAAYLRKWNRDYGRYVR